MNKGLFIIIILLLLGFFLRLYRLADIPPGINRDEAAIGYTAYSLLKTGKDEHGRSWPLSLKSFGDWKLPLYPYITMLPVALNGLTEYSVRIPSAIFGVLSLIILGFVANRIFDSKKVALITVFILTLNPWHLFFSRVASEANLGLFLILLGVVCLLYSSKLLFLTIPGFVLLSVSLFTYHGAHIFTPLFFVGCLIFLLKNRLNTTPVILGIIIFMVLSSFILSLTLISADRTKITGLLPINNQSFVHENIEKPRSIYMQKMVAKLLNNRFILLFETVTQNYLKTFSPEFFYIRGGNSMQHNIPNFGNFYIIEVPFLLLGCFFIFLKRNKYRWFLAFWILVAPLGSAITRDAPHSARTLILLPPIVLLVSLGLNECTKLLANKFLKRIFVMFICCLFITNLFIFMGRYFVVFPYNSYIAWGSGYKEMMQKVILYKNKYKEIVISRPDYSPYIYYLFYNQSNPDRVQKELVYYPETVEGFAHAKFFDGILFKKIDWTYELYEPDMLYIDWASDVPKGATNSAVRILDENITELVRQERNVPTLKQGAITQSKLIDKVETPDNVPIFYFIETRVGTTSAINL